MVENYNTHIQTRQVQAHINFASFLQKVGNLKYLPITEQGLDDQGDHKVCLLAQNSFYSGDQSILVMQITACIQQNADYIMYSTFLTTSTGSVLFSRSNLQKRKDLCFSCLRLDLIRHRRSLRSSHLFSNWIDMICRVTTREADILVNISIGIQIVLFPRTVFCYWLVE